MVSCALVGNSFGTLLQCNDAERLKFSKESSYLRQKKITTFKNECAEAMVLEDIFAGIASVVFWIRNGN